MSISIVYNIIYIHGHDNVQRCGQRTQTSLAYNFYNAKHSYFVNEYFGGLGLLSINSAASRIANDVSYWYSNFVPDDSYHSILLAGSSCGGVTACRTLELLSSVGYDIPYVGLADAAFIKGETSGYLWVPPKGSASVSYKKNYYQSLQNNSSREEVHDEIPSYSNFNLNAEVTNDNPHVSCCAVAKSKIINDMIWCIANDK